MGWEDPESRPRQFEVLEQLLKGVSHGSDSSSSRQLSSDLFWSWHRLSSTVLWTLCIGSWGNGLFVLRDFCTLVLKCPSTAWASQNRRFFNLFVPQAVWLVGVRRELSLVRLFLKLCCSDEECSNPVTSVLEYRCLVPFSVHPSCPGGRQYTGEQWHQIPNPLFWCWQFQATCPVPEHTCNIPICAGAPCGTERCLSSVPVLAPWTMMCLSVSYMAYLYPAKPFHIVWASKQATSVLLPFYLHFIFFFPNSVLLWKCVLWRGWVGGAGLTGSL